MLGSQKEKVKDPKSYPKTIEIQKSPNLEFHSSENLHIFRAHLDSISF